MTIRPVEEWDVNEVVRLSLRAWAPVFASLARVMDPEIYGALYPDWRESQRDAVETVCRDPEQLVWVAERDGALLGFVALRVHAGDSLGEIYMIAVDPDAQRTGIGKTLTEFALEWMREAGLGVAMVETGGDPGHGPARRTYERAGFRALPIARYFKKL